MIPKVIHYCWFGRGKMPPEAKLCIESWHTTMPEYQIKLWNEDNFEVDKVRYTYEAYQQKKYAFVSDYLRLFVLFHEGGIYLDTDVMAIQPFDDILSHAAFAGYEGSKHTPIGTCVMASEPGNEWVESQLNRYQDRPFVLADGSLDLTTNVLFITQHMVASGFVCDGKEKDFEGLHVFPVDFFSPRQTTGEYIRTVNTHADHLGLCSWGRKSRKGVKSCLYGTKIGISLIKIKRRIFG